MVYLLPGLHYPDGNQFDESQTIWLACTGYFTTIMFSFLLGFAVYNTWHYLIKQGKWRVLYLTMFYALAILLLCFRSIANIWFVPFSQNVNVVFIMMPLVLVILIGIVLIAIMIEINVRVRQSNTMS